MAILTTDQAYGYAQANGFSGTSADIVVAIARAESGLNTLAQHVNGDGSIDRGILQINNRYHAEVSDRQAYDASGSFLAAYTISSKGTNFSAWSTYVSGAYKNYLQSRNVASVPSSSSVVTASSNTYPKGQCTWWACQRYHDLTGYYVPWKGNANQWASLATQNGWNVASTPPQGIPSILVLQAGIQGADNTFGHVAVVEKINSDGSVYASSQNWGLNPVARSQTSYATFTTGSGVSFVWAGTGNGSLASSLLGVISGQTSVGGVLEQLHQTLIDNPGFYGMALALDEAETFTGYVNVANGVTDVSGIIRSVGITVQDNIPPVLIRGGLILMGTLLLIALIFKAAQGPVETIGKVGEMFA